MSMEPVVFTVPGAPEGKGRHKTATRVVGTKAFTKHYTPEKTVAYEGKVSHEGQVAMSGRQLIARPVLVELLILLAVPQSMSKKRKAMALAGEIMPTKKPDIDNVEKAILDGLNGVVWNDDTQVVDVIKRKRYGEIPGVRVRVVPLAAEPA